MRLRLKTRMGWMDEFFFFFFFFAGRIKRRYEIEVKLLDIRLKNFHQSDRIEMWK